MLANDVTQEEVAEALTRLLATPKLRLSERNKRFLRYVVEETLAGRSDRIKSYSIALDVFRRPADFDGAKDSIVRTEATRLRAALVAFYKDAGANERLRILMPPGAYLPRFERVEATSARSEAKPVQTPQRSFQAPAAQISRQASNQVWTRLSTYVRSVARVMSLPTAAIFGSALLLTQPAGHDFVRATNFRLPAFVLSAVRPSNEEWLYQAELTVDGEARAAEARRAGAKARPAFAYMTPSEFNPLTQPP